MGGIIFQRSNLPTLNVSVLIMAMIKKGMKRLCPNCRQRSLKRYVGISRRVLIGCIDARLMEALRS